MLPKKKKQAPPPPRDLFWVVMLLLFGVTVYYLKGVLTPFVLATVIAYVLNPFTTRLSKKMPRTGGTLVALIIFFVVGVGVLLMLVPVLGAQLRLLADLLPSYMRALGTVFREVVGDYRIFDNGASQIRDLAGSHSGTLLAVVQGVLGRVIAGSALFANFLSILFITPLVAFFMLKDWPKIMVALQGLLPRKQAPAIIKLAAGIDDKLSSFMRGQLSVMLILGAYYGVGLSLAGLDFGLVIGLFAGLISFVPFVGAILGGILSIGLALVQFYPDYSMVLVIVGVFVVGQLLEGNYLTPKLVGGQLGLHPVWVIFAVLAGGALLGFLGVLIALPVLAVLSVLVPFALDQYKQSSYYKK